MYAVIPTTIMVYMRVQHVPQRVCVWCFRCPGISVASVYSSPNAPRRSMRRSKVRWYLVNYSGPSRFRCHS